MSAWQLSKLQGEKNHFWNGTKTNLIQKCVLSLGASVKVKLSTVKEQETWRSVFHSRKLQPNAKSRWSLHHRRYYPTYAMATCQQTVICRVIYIMKWNAWNTFRTFVQRHLLFSQTHTHREQFVVRCPSQGHLDLWIGGARDQNTNITITIL